MSAPELEIEQAPKPQLTKEELERKKIELEIKDLERPFWKRPTYILAGLPTILAVVTLSVGLFNGYFSASLTKLENQKHDLQVEVNQFEARKTQLHSENAELRKEKESLEVKITELQQTYEGKVATLEQRRLELEGINSTLSQQISDLSLKKSELENKINRMSNDFNKIYKFTGTLLSAAEKIKKSIPPAEPGLRLYVKIDSADAVDKALQKTFDESLDALQRLVEVEKLKELEGILQRMKKGERK